MDYKNAGNLLSRLHKIGSGGTATMEIALHGTLRHKCKIIFVVLPNLFAIFVIVPKNKQEPPQNLG